MSVGVGDVALIEYARAESTMMLLLWQIFLVLN